MSIDTVLIQATSTFHVGTTQGYSLYMERGQKKEVSRELANEAFKKGTAVAISSLEDDATPLNSDAEFLESEIRERVNAAVQRIINEGDPAKHTANGRPKVAAVRAQIPDIDSELITAEMVDEEFADVLKLVD